MPTRRSLGNSLRLRYLVALRDPDLDTLVGDARALVDHLVGSAESHRDVTRGARLDSAGVARHLRDLVEVVKVDLRGPLVGAGERGVERSTLGLAQPLRRGVVRDLLERLRRVLGGLGARDDLAKAAGHAAPREGPGRPESERLPGFNLAVVDERPVGLGRDGGQASPGHLSSDPGHARAARRSDPGPAGEGPNADVHRELRAELERTLCQRVLLLEHLRALPSLPCGLAGNQPLDRPEGRGPGDGLSPGERGLARVALALSLRACLFHRDDGCTGLQRDTLGLVDGDGPVDVAAGPDDGEAVADLKLAHCSQPVVIA